MPVVKEGVARRDSGAEDTKEKVYVMMLRLKKKQLWELHILFLRNKLAEQRDVQDEKSCHSKPCMRLKDGVSRESKTRRRVQSA